MLAMGEDEIVSLTLSEDSMFRFPSIVDELIEANPGARSDGVFKFSLQESDGHGTPLNDLLTRFGKHAVTVLKRLNPISVPQTKSFFGHICIDSDFLESDVVDNCKALLTDPTSYCVSSDESCCLHELESGGTEALFSHYFEHELQGNAKHPPQRGKCPSKKGWKKKAALARKKFETVNKKLDMLPSAEAKAYELDEALKKLSQGKSCEESLCKCWQCVTSDEVLVMNEGEDHASTSLYNTEKYYRGRGFMYANGLSVPHDLKIRISKNFSLSYLWFISILCQLEQHLPGVSSPYLYFGFTHSFFPIHIEDLSLWSINFLHFGFPKVWIVVPPHAISKLNYCLALQYTLSGHGTCSSRLTHKYHVPTVVWLRNHGIPFKVIVQKSGEAVVLGPNAAHFGWNLGQNIAEAINFATTSWVPYGIVYPKCSCLMGQIHSDLSSIIANTCPEMLSAYLDRAVPKVDCKNFYKCIMYPPPENEVEYAAVGFEIGAPVDEVESSSNEDDEESAVLIQPKMIPNRKQVRCPVCNVGYKGGQRKRLENHISFSHRNLSVHEKAELDEALKKMFPERGSKLPKRQCSKCGKLVARSMKLHQESKGCVTYPSSSST